MPEMKKNRRRNAGKEKRTGGGMPGKKRELTDAGNEKEPAAECRERKENRRGMPEMKKNRRRNAGKEKRTGAECRK